jgi:hypothetical protein
LAPAAIIPFIEGHGLARYPQLQVEIGGKAPFLRGQRVEVAGDQQAGERLPITILLQVEVGQGSPPQHLGGCLDVQPFGISEGLVVHVELQILMEEKLLPLPLVLTLAGFA